MELKEQLEAARVIIEGMNKEIDKLKGSKADPITQEKIDKLVAASIVSLHPPEKKMIFTNDEEVKLGDNEEKIGLNKFLKMVKYNDQRLVKTIMEEGTDAQGGYLIDTGLASGIIGELNNSAPALPMMSTWGQTWPTQNIPRYLTDLTVFWVEENATKTLTKPTLDRPQSVVKKIACIVPMTDEMLEDQSAINQAELTRLVKENIATELERVALVGTVAGGDVFNGIFYVAGTNAVAQAGANLDYDDLVDVQTNANVLTAYRGNRVWVMNDVVLALVMKLRDNQNRPIWSLNMPEQGAPSTLLGSKYVISQNMIDTGLIYGNLKNHLISQLKGRESLKITVSQCAVAPNPTPTQNAFMNDETWFRFVIRRGSLTHLPGAFGKLTGIA